MARAGADVTEERGGMRCHRKRKAQEGDGA